MVDLMSFLFATGVGFGLAFWVMGTLLDKSNNIGDSRGDSKEYNAYIHFTARKDKMSNSEKDSFCNMYAERIDNSSAAPHGTELVRRLSDEEIERYKKKEGAPRGAYRSEENHINSFNDTEAEFEEWEKHRNPDAQMPDAFVRRDPRD